VEDVSDAHRGGDAADGNEQALRDLQGSRSPNVRIYRAEQREQLF